MRDVLIDANVFVSSWTLNVTMCLADEGIVRPLWSEKVLEELERASRRLGRQRLASTIVKSLMEHYPSSLVEGWEGRVNSIELPDPDDRHVVAAALEAECDAIVTFNLRDFPQDVLEGMGVRALSPDDLAMELVHEHPVRVLMAVEGLIEAKRRPPRTYDEEIEGLRRCGLRRFAEWLDS